MKLAFLSNPLHRLGLLLLLAGALFAANAPAQTYVYTNATSAGGNWSQTTGWTNGNTTGTPAAGGATNDIIYFNFGTTSITTTNNFAGAFMLNQLVIQGPESVTLWCSNTASGISSLMFTNNGSTLPSITNNLASGNRTLTLNTPITLATNLNITVAGIATVMNSNITEVAVGTTLAAINYVTNNGILGANTNWLQLMASNSYAGGTTNSGSMIIIGNPGALGLGPLIMNGGALSNTLSVILTNTINLMPTNCSFVVESGTTMTLGNGTTATLTNVGPLVSRGFGTLILKNPATFTGGVTNMAGTLGIFTDAGLGAAPVSAVSNLTFGGSSELQFQASGAAWNANRGIQINSGATATLDSQNFVITNIPGVVSGAGQLYKFGSGIVALSGANTYTGSTIISNGTLYVNGNSSAANGSVLVTGGISTLAGNGTIGGTVTNLTGGTIMPCTNNFLFGVQFATSSNAVPAKLTLTNGLGLSGGATLAFTITNATVPGTTYGQIAVTNGYTVVNGTNYVQIYAPSNGTIAAGTYYLLTNTVARTGSGIFAFPNGTTNLGNLWLTNGPNGLILTATADTLSPFLTWKGNLNTNWDTTTLNWNSGVATNYSDGSYVIFDDTAVKFSVTNAAAFSPLPGSVTFNNNNNNYYIYPSIGGTGALTLNGSGKVFLAGTNFYTGNTAVNNGGLIVTNGASISNSFVKVTGNGILSVSNTATIVGPVEVGQYQSNAANAIVFGTIVTNLTIDAGSFPYRENNDVSAGNPPIAGTNVGYVNVFSGASISAGGYVTNNGVLSFTGVGSAQVFPTLGTLVGTNAGQNITTGLFVPGFGCIYDGGSVHALNFQGGSGFDVFFPNPGNITTLQITPNFSLAGPASNTVAFSGWGYSDLVAGVNLWTNYFNGGNWVISRTGHANSNTRPEGTVVVTNGATITVVTNGQESGNWKILNGSVSFAGLGNSYVQNSTGSQNNGNGLNFVVTTNGSVANSSAALYANGISFGSASNGVVVTTNSLIVGNGGIAWITNNLNLGVYSGAAGYTNSTGVDSNSLVLTGGKLLVGGILNAFTNTQILTGYVTNCVTWSGGQLSAFAIYPTNAFNNPVSCINVTSVTNSAGTLAPGDTGTAGQTTIRGNYIQLGQATLDIDINGAVPATTFQQASAYDNLVVTNQTTLAGTLLVRTNGSYTPTATSTYAIVTNTATGLGLSATFTNIYANRVTVVGGQGASFQVATNFNTNSVVLTNFSPLIASWLVGNATAAINNFVTFTNNLVGAITNVVVNYADGGGVTNTYPTPYYTNLSSITYTSTYASRGTYTNTLIVTASDNTTVTNVFLVNAGISGGLTWGGAGGNGNWDVNTTANWTNNGLAAKYFNGDAVAFNDFGLSPNSTVSLNTTVTPGSVTFSNDTGSGYTISGSGGIGGSASLINASTGVIVNTLNTVNTYTGGTYLTGGELSISAYTNLPAIGGLNFNGGTLQITGTAITNLNNYTINGSTFNGGLDIVSAANTLTVTNAIGGTGTLTKLGAGTLALTNANTFSGGLYIKSGAVFGSTSPTALGTGTNFLGDTGGSASATLAIKGTSSMLWTNPIIVQSGNSGTMTISNIGTGNAVLTNNVTLQKPLTLAAASSGAVILAGNITGSSQITITNNGEVLDNNYVGLDGNNVNFTGPVVITAGAELRYDNTASTGYGTGPGLSANNVVQVNAGAALKLVTNPTIAGLNDNAGAGGVVTNSGASTARTLTVGGSGTYSFNGIIVDGSQPDRFTMAGTGTQVLGGNNTYSGVTTISSGTLLVNGNDSATTNTYTVSAGGNLGGTGTIGGNVTNLLGSVLSPGGLTNSVGTLTLTNGLGLNGAELVFNLTNATTPGVTYSQVVVTNGAFVANGTNNIQIYAATGTLKAGTYTLITNTVANTGTGTFVFLATGTTNWTVGGANLVLTNGANSVVLFVSADTAFANLTWKGYLSGTWDTTTANWFNGALATYSDGQVVIFDDAANQFTVTNVSPFSPAPASVTFENNGNNYVIAAPIQGSGTVTLNGNKQVIFTGANTYTGGTTINNTGNLIVTNGGAIKSPLATLNILNGTNTLTGTGSITVATLLATNNNFTATNSTFNFSGGTLTTSNYNGQAATILIASNATYSINGNWTMNAGTNLITESAGITNLNNKVVSIGTAAASSGIVITVNTNATWLLGTIAPSAGITVPTTNCFSTNNYSLTLGSGTGSTNNQLVVNGGVVSNVFVLNIATGNSIVGNQLIITNGGQLYCGFAIGNTGGQVGGSLGGNTGDSSNSVVVMGTNSSGGKSILDFGSTRFQIGNNATAQYNTIRVDQGGMITNTTLYMIGSVNNTFIVTNGGAFYCYGQTAMIGRNASTNNLVIVAGADSAGNPSIFNNFSQNISLSGFGNSTLSNNGTNNGLWIAQGGLVTNALSMCIGGLGNAEINDSGNFLIVTNGGRCYTAGSSTIGVGTNDNGNWAYVGGAFGSTNALWNLMTNSLAIGAASNVNNSMTVGTGGVVTNITTLTLGGSSLATNNGLTVNGGSLYANTVNVITNSYLTLTNNGVVSGAVNINGGIFGGSGTNLGSASITAQSRLAPGGLGIYGRLTISSNLTLNGGNSLMFDLNNATTAGTTYDQIVITGTNIVNANTYLQLNAAGGVIPTGTYLLMTNTFAKLGFGLVVFPNGSTNLGNLTLANGPNSVVLTATANTSITNLMWKGTVNGTWDFATTYNWFNGVSTNYFGEGNVVTFDDSASAFTVTNAVGFSYSPSPLSVIFSNSANNYVMGVAIGGSGGVGLLGTSQVIFTNANTYAGNTTIAGTGTLIVTNGGSIFSPAGSVSVQFGTNTLTGSGAITVKSLVAANNSIAATNSFVNLNGGTLITSNLNGVAASIVLPTNTSFNLNSSWTMNAGTNTIISTWQAAGGNGTGAKACLIGTGAANSGLVVAVNSNAVWSLGNQANTIGGGGTNNLTLALGSGTGSTNNLLLINGGIVTNAGGGNWGGGVFSIGTGTSAVGNQLIITNGGQLYTGDGDGNTTYTYVGSGSGANSNSIVIINPNLAGPKSIWNAGNCRFALGANAVNHYNTIRIDQGGWVNNINVLLIGVEDSTFIVTNGGLLTTSGFDLGRGNSTNNTTIVAGADANGNLATMNGNGGNFAIGATTAGSGANALNNIMWIMQNGQITNMATVFVGGGAAGAGNAAADSNMVGSGLIITNGGQLSSTGSSYIGYATNCNNNYVYVGTSFGSTNALWNLNSQFLRIGGGLGAGNSLSRSNTLTVGAGGVVTNISTLTLGNDITATNNGVIVGGGYLYASTMFVNTNNYLTLTNNGNVVGTVNVNGGTYFVGTGTNNGAINISAQGTLALGGYGTQGAIGTLTISSNLILNGGSPANGGNPLIYTIVDPSSAGTSYDQIVINGSLVIPGNNFLQLNVSSGTIPAGTYTLMTYPQGRQGLGNVVFPVTGSTNWGNLQLANGPTSLVLTVSADTLLSSATNNLTWNGNLSGTWDSAADSATANWNSNGVAQTYVDGDYVRFDDTATSYDVTNNAGSSGYSPGSVLFVNNANNYVMGAAINGAANVTLAGTMSVTFTGTNTYTGNTVVNSGLLQVGDNSGSGQIWTNISLAGGSLTYNQPNNYTQQGVIGGGSGASSITNNGTYATTTNTLWLADGFNLFNYIANNSGTLILNGSANSTNYFAAGGLPVAGSSLIPAQGATIQLNGGNFIFTNANQANGGGSLIVNGGNIYAVYTNAGGAGMNGSGATNFTLNSGNVVVGGGGGIYMVSNNDAFYMNGGNLTLLPNAYRGFRFGGPGGSGSGPNVNFTGVQTGGTIAVSAMVVAGGTGGFDMGGFTANVTDTYTLSGGLLEITNGPISGNSIQMCATNSANGGLTMFTLTNSGQLLVNGNIANAVAATTSAGANVVFAFDGGILAAANFNAFGLRSDVSNGAFGVLTNNGGTLAPGWTNNPGLMTINGSYVQNGNGTLDIDLAGAAPAGVFTNYPSPAGYDQLIVTNWTILNGTLVVRTNGSFSPTSINSFTVLTNWNNAANNFLSVSLNNIYNNRVAVLGGLGYSFQVVTNANTLTLTNFEPIHADWNLDTPVSVAAGTPILITNFQNSLGAITNVIVQDSAGNGYTNAVGPNGNLVNASTTVTYGVAGTYFITNTVYASDGTSDYTWDTITVLASGASLTWNGASGSGGNGIWDTDTSVNWWNGSANSAFTNDFAVTFDDSGISSGITNVQLDQTVSPQSVQFTNTSGTYTISTTTGLGNIADSGAPTAVTVGQLNGISSGIVTLATTNSYSGGTYLNAGTIQLGANSPLGTGLVTFNGGTLAANGPWTLTNAMDLAFPVTMNASGGNFTLAGSSITDVGALTNAGTGIVTLSGTNGYGGGTYLVGGELSISGYTNLPTTGGLNFNGGTLQVTGTAITNLNPYTVNWGAFNGGLDVASAANTLTVTNIIGGTNSLNLPGAGSVTLTATNTFSGPVTNSAGTLTIGGGGWLGRGNYTNYIINNGTLVYNSTGNQVNAGNMSGTGSVTVENTGQITLGGGGGGMPIVCTGQASTYTNVLTVASTAGISVGQTLFYNNAGGVGIGQGAGAVNPGYAWITNLTATTISINGNATNFNNTTAFVQGSTYTGGTTVTNNGTLTLNCADAITNGVLASSATGVGNITLWNGSIINNNNGNNFMSAPQINITNINGANGNIYLTNAGRLHVRANTLDLGNATNTFWVNNTQNGYHIITNASSLAPFMNTPDNTGSSAWEIPGGPNGSGMTVQNGVMDLETAYGYGSNYVAFQFTVVPNFVNASLTIGTNVLLWGTGSGASTMPLTINKGGIWELYDTSHSIASLSDGIGGGSVYATLTTNAAAPAVTLTINNTIGNVTTNTFSGNIGNGPATNGNTAVLLALTKSGSSTQILSGTNTYSGGTLINGGELLGGTGGSCSNSPVTVTSTGTNGVQLAAAGGKWTCGALTNNDGSYADFNFNGFAPSTTTAPLVVNGSVAFTNANVIIRNVVGGTLATGYYPLIKYGSGSITGFTNYSTLVTLSGVSIGGGNSAYLVIDGANKSIDLAIEPPVATVAAGSTFTWVPGNGNWDIITTNWAVGGVSGYVYQDGYNVLLDNTATGSGSAPILVTNTMPAVYPLSVTNNSQSYTLYGNAIAGAGVLTKNGTGTLTIYSPNTYTGGTFANGGMLDVETNLALGTGLLTLNGANLTNNAGSILTNNINLASSATVGVASGKLLALSGSITNTGSLTIVGAVSNSPVYSIIASTNVGNSYLLTVQGGTSGALAGVVVGQTLYYPNSGVVGINNTGFAQITNVNPITGTIGINQFASNFNNTAAFVEGSTYSGGTTVASGGTLAVYGNSQTNNNGVISGATGKGNLTMQDGSSINDNDGSTSSQWYVPAVYFQGNVTNTGNARSHWGFGTLDLGNATRTLALNGTKFIGVNTTNSPLAPTSSWNEGTSSGQIETAGIAGAITSGWVVTNGILDLETRTSSNPTNYALFLWGQTPFFTNASLLIGSNVIVAGFQNMGPSVQVAINKGGIFQWGGGQNSQWTMTIASLSDGSIPGGSVFGSLTNLGTLGGPAQSLTINNGANPNASTYFSGTIGNGNPYAGAMSLIKSSPSIQTLAGTNTYTGSTTINGGELAGVTGGSSSNSAVTVTAAGTSGVVIATAGAQWVCGALTNQFGSTLDFNFSNHTPSTTTAPLLVVNTGVTPMGNVAFTNANIIVRNVAGNTLAAGEYPLIKYTGTLTGANVNGALIPATLTLPGTLGGFITNNTANSSIDLVILPGASLVWATNSGNWDIQATGNWQSGGIYPLTYSDGEPVTFDDTASSGGNTSILVTNAVTVNPLSVTANLTNDNYTIYGNPIAGAGVLTKNGPGMLSLNNTNTYTGATVINAGIVAANSSFALGTGLVTLNSGTLSNSTPAVGTVINMTNAINLASASTIGIAAGVTNVYYGATGSITNTGALTQVGGGTLVIANAQAKFSGGYTLNSGELDLSANSLGSGSITVNGGIFAAINVARTLTNSVFNIGGSFQFGGGTSGYGSVNALGLTCPLNVGTGANTLTLANSLGLGGTVYNTGSLEAISTGAYNLTITNYSGVANTFSGGLTVSNAILNISSQSSLGSGAVTVTNLASLNNLSSPAGTFAVTNAFNVNGTLTYLGSAAGLILAAPVKLAGNTTVSVSTNTLTVSNVISDGGHGYALTKSGASTLVLDGLNTYSGNTTNSAGVLQVGNNDNLGSIPGNIILNGGNLAYNLTNNYTQAGVITGSSGLSAITNTGTYATATNTLALADGFNLFTNIANNSGTLILTGSANSTNYFTAGSGGSGSSLVPAAGATIQLNSGYYVFTNGYQSAGGGSLVVNGGNIRTFTNNVNSSPLSPSQTNFTINSGLVQVGGGYFGMGVNNQTFNLNGGTLYLDPTAFRGLRLGGLGGSGSGAGVNFTGVQTGGTNAISGNLSAGGSSGFDMGSTNFANQVDTYTLSGGLLEITNNNGASATLFTMGGPTNSGNTSLIKFTLNNTGALLVNGNISAGSSASANPNANVVFALDGGTFAANTFYAFGLRSDVSGGAFGVLTNAGGTLAPGWTNNAGQMTIQGSYVQTANSTLDIDVDGATVGNNFTNYPSPAGYDQLVVTNQVTLNGTLVVRTNGSYSPPATGSYTVVNGQASANGLSATLTNIYNNRVAVLGGLGYSFQVVTNANTLVLTNFGALTAAWTVVQGAGSTVTFTNNNSIGAITNWAVNFGDGNPVENHPFTSPNSALGSVGTSHTYPNPLTQTYTATLTVYASDGTTAQTTVTIGTPTTTALAVSSNPSTYGQTVTVTATVSPNPFGGTVQFYTNGVALGSAQSVNAGTGQATLDVNTTIFAAGHTYSVSATNSGNGYFLSSGTTVPNLITVNQASNYLALASSIPGTNGYLDNVYFTATAITNGATATLATGNVIFSYTNYATTASASFSTNALVLGTTNSLTISTLARGTNLITAAYAGDNNYLGWTNSVLQVVTNHPPMATVMYVTNTAGVDTMIKFADVATNWSDLDPGDTVTMTSISLVSTNGRNLSTNTFGGNTWILYTNAPSVNDQFTYSISDGQGGTNIGYVNLILGTSPMTGQMPNINYGGGSVSLTFYGAAGFSYTVQRTLSLTPEAWVDISNYPPTYTQTNVVMPFADTNNPAAYYRLKSP